MTNYAYVYGLVRGDDGQLYIWGTPGAFKKKTGLRYPVIMNCLRACAVAMLSIINFGPVTGQNGGVVQQSL